MAYIHDAGFGDFARKSAPQLLAMLRQAGIRRGNIVELGCGSGMLAAKLVAAGHTVLGIDQSRA
ncbi:MAG: class I SAM-dependent methyltransferase, partial [Tepidisphaeraceae bacterium]